MTTWEQRPFSEGEMREWERTLLGQTEALRFAMRAAGRSVAYGLGLKPRDMPALTVAASRVYRNLAWFGAAYACAVFLLFVAHLVGWLS